MLMCPIEVITPNGQSSDTALATKNTITAVNTPGSAQAQFTVTVAAPTS